MASQTNYVFSIIHETHVQKYFYTKIPARPVHSVSYRLTGKILFHFDFFNLAPVRVISLSVNCFVCTDTDIIILIAAEIFKCDLRCFFASCRCLWLFHIFLQTVLHLISAYGLRRLPGYNKRLLSS